ncbi:hypothetical protein ACLOJK_007459, partial [Asimina triloba]
RFGAPPEHQNSVLHLPQMAAMADRPIFHVTGHLFSPNRRQQRAEAHRTKHRTSFIPPEADQAGRGSGQLKMADWRSICATLQRTPSVMNG